MPDRDESYRDYLARHPWVGKDKIDPERVYRLIWMAGRGIHPDADATVNECRLWAAIREAIYTVRR